MNKFRGFVKSHAAAASLVSSAFCAQSCAEPGFRGCRPLPGQMRRQSDDELVADFRRVEVASVSDALEQLTGKRMYMSHRMHPIFTTKFAGLARTVLLKKDEGNNDPAALNGMLEAIDQGSTNSVYRDGGRRRRGHRRNGRIDGHGDGCSRLRGSRDRWRSSGRGVSAQDRVSGVCDRHRAVDVCTSLSIWRIADCR